MTGRVVCVGEVMVDVVARLPGELAPGTDTPAPITLLGGGSAANTAAWLANAGVPTTFVGRVGDDLLGQIALDELAGVGVDLAVSVDPQQPTGACIVLVGADGERTMVPSAGANAALGDEPLPRRLPTNTRHVHISAYSVLRAGARPAADEAVRLAAEAACAVSVDAASAALLRDFGAGAFLAWLPACLLFANLDEAEVLTGSGDPVVAAPVLAARCGEAIVKCGAQGAVWSDGHAVIREASSPTDVLDSTGAGDAFAAGVLAARAGGGEVRDWLRAGTVLAARAIGAVGGRPPRQAGLSAAGS